MNTGNPAPRSTPLERTMKRFLLPAVLALLLPVAPIEASSFTTSGTTIYKVSRLRLTSTGRVYVGITRTPAATVSNDCPTPDNSQQYYFDTTTLQGRILYNQLLSSYTTQSRVSGGGDANDANCVSTGTICLIVFPNITFGQAELLTTFTVQQQ